MGLAGKREKNWLKECLRDLVRAGGSPGGALALSAGPNQEMTAVWGSWAGKASEAVLPDTLYDLASISKLFTAALILRLHQKRDLSVGQRAGDFLANFRRSEIKIIDLLTHRVDFGVRLADYRRDPNRFEERIMGLVPPKKNSPEVHYANLGFIYLGKIVERVSRQKLRPAVNQLIENLHLMQTATGPDLELAGFKAPPTEATAQGVVQNVVHDESARLLGGIAGHAGLFANVLDLASFGRAWLEGKIVDRGLINELVFKNYDSSGRRPQALGWWLRLPLGNSKNRPGVYSHTGFTGPLLAINPANDKVCAFVCNRTWYGRNNQKHQEVWRRLVDWIAAG